MYVSIHGWTLRLGNRASAASCPPLNPSIQSNHGDGLPTLLKIDPRAQVRSLATPHQIFAEREPGCLFGRVCGMRRRCVVLQTVPEVNDAKIQNHYQRLALPAASSINLR